MNRVAREHCTSETQPDKAKDSRVRKAIGRGLTADHTGRLVSGIVIAGMLAIDDSGMSRMLLSAKLIVVGAMRKLSQVASEGAPGKTDQMKSCLTSEKLTNSERTRGP